MREILPAFAGIGTGLIGCCGIGCGGGGAGAAAFGGICGGPFIFECNGCAT